MPRPKTKRGIYTTFTVVYPRSLRPEARELLGAWVSCAKCGRGGPVVALRPMAGRRW